MSTKDLIHLSIVAVLAIGIGIAFARLYSFFNPPEPPLPAEENAPHNTGGFVRPRPDSLIPKRSNARL